MSSAVPAMARAMAPSARPWGSRRRVTANQTAIMAGAVNCSTVAVAVLAAAMAAI